MVVVLEKLQLRHADWEQALQDTNCAASLQGKLSPRRST